MAGRWARPAWGAVLVVAAVNALWRLDRADWKLDENVYAQAGWALWHGTPTGNPEHPPLGKALIGLGELVSGRSTFGVRVVPALAFLGAVVVLFAFGRRVGGWWTGIVAAGLFAALPRSLVVAGHAAADIRVDRYGLLEAVAGPLLIAALWCGWRWITGGGRVWAGAAGALLGFAACSKLTAAVAIVPVVVVGAALRWGRRRLAAEVALLVGVAVAAFLLPFAFYGADAFHAMGEMIRTQRDHARIGHLLVLDGSIWTRSPWWANARYQWDADGPLLTGALLAGLAAAVVSRRRPVVTYLLAVVLSLAGALALSPVALPHYRAIWTAPLVLLVAVGLVDLLQRSRPAPRVVGALVLAVLVGVGALTTARVATLGEGDYHRLARLVAADGVQVRRSEIYAESVAPYFPGSIELLAPFDLNPEPAQLLVLDPTLAAAIDPATIDRWRGWARRWGLRPHRVGRLEAWWAAR
ncbi:MAG: hypothetical protein JWN46_1303 [Acidimicrobiales bacterium]|nr:hypothetical protein [Acidimicrobiales bacterium]